MLLPSLILIHAISSLPRPPVLDKKHAVRGTIDIEEGSGVAALPGGKLLVVGDGNSGKGERVLGVLNASDLLNGGDHTSAPLTPSTPFNDLEEAIPVPGPNGTVAVYLIGSASLNSDGEYKPPRCRIGKVVFDASGTPSLVLQVGNEPLREALVNVTKEKSPYTSTSLYTWSRPEANLLNIEGGAYVPGTGFLIGLRAPVVADKVPGKAKAIVLTAKTLEPSGAAKPEPILKKYRKLAFVDPKGPLPTPVGIRAMAYDPVRKGCWVLTGKSTHLKPDQSPFGRWGLWFWDIKSKKPRFVDGGNQEEKAGRPEGICLLTLSGHPGLLIVYDAGNAGEGAPKNTPYAWFPFIK